MKLNRIHYKHHRDNGDKMKYTMCNNCYKKGLYTVLTIKQSNITRCRYCREVRIPNKS